MSRRAYRIIKIEMADASFDIFEEDSLVEFLNSQDETVGNFYDDSGTVEVPIGLLRKALIKSADLKLSGQTINSLKKDINSASKNNDDTITYSCF